MVVDRRNDRIDARQQLFEHLLRPGLQRFLHHRMVGIVEYLADDPIRLIPAQMLLVQQYAQKLGDGEGRMRIVDLQHHLVGQRSYIAETLFMLAHHVLHGGGSQEIILL